MSRWVKKINPNLAERAAGLACVGGGVGWAVSPAWGVVAVGALILGFDVLDWLLTWAKAQPKGTD